MTNLVKYLGRKYGEEKNQSFKHADIFAFQPIMNICLGNLEAMQHALAVVSTYDGGITDIVEDGISGFS